jgi:hypothetical protein
VGDARAVLRAAFDEPAVAHVDHQLVAQVRRELAQPHERGNGDDRAGDAADDELALPAVVAIQGVAGHDGDHERAQHRAERPETHRRPAPHLGREVADQRRGPDQHDPLDEAEGPETGRELELGGA